MIPITATRTARVMPRMTGVVSPCCPLLDPFPDSLVDKRVEVATARDVVTLARGTPSIKYETDCVGPRPPAADMIPFLVAVDTACALTELKTEKTRRLQTSFNECENMMDIWIRNVRERPKAEEQRTKTKGSALRTGVADVLNKSSCQQRAQKV